MIHRHTCIRASALLLALAAPLHGQQRGALVVHTENRLAADRADETISIGWSALRQALPGVQPNRVRVVDAGTGAEVVSQPLDGDGDGTMDALLFQASYRPRETRAFVVEAMAPRDSVRPRAHARHDAHRDDVAWESDRIAFRIYGQGLWQAKEFEPLVSSGLDI